MGRLLLAEQFKHNNLLKANMDFSELTNLITIRQYVVNATALPAISRQPVSELNGILLLLNKKLSASCRPRLQGLYWLKRHAGCQKTCGPYYQYLFP